LTWVRGQSGNPRGRIRGEPELAPALRRLLRRRDPATGKQNKLLVAEALLARALSGEVDAIREVFNRVDGPLNLPVEHSGDARVRFEVVYVDEASPRPAFVSGPSSLSLAPP
jgi:Family of unknown function (DUF5681)